MAESVYPALNDTRLNIVYISLWLDYFQYDGAAIDTIQLNVELQSDVLGETFISEVIYTTMVS
jgi:hypothetical protein